MQSNKHKPMESTMKYIIAIFLCVVTYTTAHSCYTIDLFKKVITGGNTNATIGQVIAGYKNGNHIGIRIPKRLATSVEDFSGKDASFISNVYPNPTNQETVFFMMDDVKSVLIYDIYGTIITNAYDLSARKITLPYRGVFYITFTTTTDKVYSSRVIFN